MVVNVVPSNHLLCVSLVTARVKTVLHYYNTTYIIWGFLGIAISWCVKGSQARVNKLQSLCMSITPLWCSWLSRSAVNVICYRKVTGSIPVEGISFLAISISLSSAPSSFFPLHGPARSLILPTVCFCVIVYLRWEVAVCRTSGHFQVPYSPKTYPRENVQNISGPQHGESVALLRDSEYVFTTFLHVMFPANPASSVLVYSNFKESIVLCLLNETRDIL